MMTTEHSIDSIFFANHQLMSKKHVAASKQVNLKEKNKPK